VVLSLETSDLALGPPWLPILGSSLYFKRLCREKRYLHLAFDHLSQKYDSPVIGLKLGNEPTVAVLTHEVVQQVHTREEYEGRPYNFFIKLRSMGARRGKRMGKPLLVRSKIPGYS
jgi:hypothetical protein